MPPTTPVTTVLETATVTVDTSIITSCTTITEQYHTTVSATHGQTIILNSPSSSESPTPTPAVPTTKIYPTTYPEPTGILTSTTTATELDIYLEASGTVYSIWTIPLSSQYPSQVTATTGQLAYVVGPAPCSGSGWDCWSAGAKAGLVVGVVAAAALLAWALIWCLKRNNEWIAHDWRWARSVMGPVNGGVVPTVGVQGSLDPRLATPYGYGVGQGQGMTQYGQYGQYGHPGWGYVR